MHFYSEQHNSLYEARVILQQHCYDLYGFVLDLRVVCSEMWLYPNGTANIL